MQSVVAQDTARHPTLKGRAAFLHRVDVNVRGLQPEGLVYSKVTVTRQGGSALSSGNRSTCTGELREWESGNQLGTPYYELSPVHKVVESMFTGVVSSSEGLLFWYSTHIPNTSKIGWGYKNTRKRAMLCSCFLPVATRC